MLNCKVAYISDQRLPVQKANTEQLMNTVSALAGEGIDIELVIPRRWRTLPVSKAKLKKRLLNFYHVTDCLKLKELFHLPFSPFKLDKVTHGLLGPLYAAIAKHDIVYTRNSLPALVALSLGKNVVFEAYRVYHGISAVKLAKLTAASDLINIITHSIPSRDSLIKLGADPEKVRAIPNGFNPKPLTPPIAKSEARHLVGWKENEKIVTFAGRIDVNKGANTILELAERTPEIVFTLIGYARDDKEDWVLKAAEKRGLDNVRKLPWVTTSELAKYLFASDVLLIPPTAGPMMQHGHTVLPIKTFIYMAAGRCILAPALPDTAGVLNDQNAALVAPDNIDLAAKTIRKIFEDKAWARSIAKQAQLDSKNFTWRSRAKKIIQFLMERLQDYEN